MKRGGGRSGKTPDRKLDDVYAQVPDAGCKGLCEGSCASISLTPQEQQRIRVRTGVDLPRFGVFSTVTNPDGRCPALVDERCSIYANRPLVCRLWGVEATMECPHGCVPAGGHLSAEEGRRLAGAAQRLAGVDRASEGDRAINSIRDFFQ